MSVNKIISDEFVEACFKNTNFGSVPPRQVIRETLLKCACGYKTGRTATDIVYEMNLVTNRWTLTSAGREYLYEAYEGKNP